MRVLFLICNSFSILNKRGKEKMLSQLSLTVLLIFTSFEYTKGACNVEGVTYPEGPFRHPEDACKVCFCCLSGSYTCKLIECPEPKCGINKQNFSADGCCKVCSPECDQVSCKTPKCVESRYAYEPDACCPTVGCNVRNTDWPFDTVPVGTFGSCGRCQCRKNGIVKCRKAKCPTERLKCVDAVTTTVNGECEYVCPQGTTCRRSEVILQAGVFKEVGFLHCTCSEMPYYTRGFCLKSNEFNPLVKQAQESWCTAPTPTLPASESSRIDYETFLYTS